MSLSTNSVFIFAILIFGCGLVAVKANDYLPALHQIQSYSFSAPYSCAGSYNTSAMFLSSYALRQNEPDLLYNGVCGSDLYFQSATAGDDFAVISLIGNVSLEEVTANMAFLGLSGQGSSFMPNQPAIPSMSYAALLTKSEIRALFAFRVVSINNVTKACEIEYAVLSYSSQYTVAASPGWSWDGNNTFSQTPSAFEVTTAILDPVDSMTIMGVIMGVAIICLVVAVIVLGVKLRHRSGYSQIQH